MIILKCLECRNTFKVDNLEDGKIISCPTCDAELKVSLKNGKIKLEAFFYESEAVGEL